MALMHNLMHNLKQMYRVSTNISCRGFEETLCHPSQEACADQLQLEPARLHLERQTLAHSDAFRRIPTLSICI